jgi:uncharacterized membrane protein YhdT
MKINRLALINTSVAMLCILGAKSAINLLGVNLFFSGRAAPSPVTMLPVDIFVWFGLAYAQWKKEGRWAFGIGILAFIALLAFGFLLHLMYKNGASKESPVGFVFGASLGLAPLLVLFGACLLLILDAERSNQSKDPTP